ncbi:MAG: STAS domain-containing protein [Bacteroidales bacterium]|jgi:anti-sigma B factor antagonist|nr:STAS domain-containing protein [Bacteroidales bacterium]
MEISINKSDKVTTVRMIGRLDTTAAQEIAKDMEAVEAETSGTVILDCSELTYISSSGLRIFLTLRKEAAVRGGKVIVKSISNDIRQVFMMTGFLNLFQIED